ncbi:MAG: FHA domain-containing protein [Prevotella sp.]|jgi:DNA-directed RNA polymerase subunit M/transcription elongation factor TFIIS
MKKIRCPQCENIITFNEKKYDSGKTLVFSCPKCGKRFGIRLKHGSASDKQISQEKGKEEEEKATQTDNNEKPYVGTITVIENVFHYKQIIPLQMGDNVIGRFMKGSKINCPIETNDPSIDMTHCVINVSLDKKGNLKYVLRDGPSNTGTFVNNEILGDRERRVISDGTLFTIGATSIILKTHPEED